MAPVAETGPKNTRDESVDFDNSTQDMDVADKAHPALGPTEGSQDAVNLNTIIVPVGAYTDPGNPAALSASVNLALDKSPIEHAEDYGEGIPGHAVETPMDLHTDSVPAASDLLAPAQRGAATGTPANREEWKKSDWVAQASTYSLPTSGNMDTVKGRVEEYEADQEAWQEEVKAAKELNAGDWIAQVEGASDTEDLDRLHSLYNESGADFTTVETAFDDKRAALGSS